MINQMFCVFPEAMIERQSDAMCLAVTGLIRL